MLSVIIPASNEETYIGQCLGALLTSETVPGGAEVVVVANGCHDATFDIARGFAGRAAAAGWGFVVLDLAQGSKPAALNAGDNAAQGEMRAYLDADVQVAPALMAQLVSVLLRDAPAYASGTPVIPRPKSWVTRAYTRFWQCLPFAQSTAPGYGLFAVNAGGRARWGAFPGIISDDTFVRLQFMADERLQCPATYTWPMIEGFAPLVRVRRRQDAGVAEIARLFPDLPGREGRPAMGILDLTKMALRDPLGFGTYAAVSVAVRLRRRSKSWTRGR
ncbi:MAG: glycosyltransferase [Paracoccaceae bacterium]